MRQHTARAGHRASTATGLSPDAITMRLASVHDARDLDRLAQLDSARPPAGPTLVAELDGQLVAAVPLHGGTPIADPFRPTAQLVTLLQVRAALLVSDGRPRQPFHNLLRRWRPTPAPDPRNG